MHALKVSTTCLAALISFAALAQEFPDERYRVKLTLSGSLVTGSQELAPMLASPDTRQAALDTPPPALVRDRRYQLGVTITDPSGVTQTYTRSHRLRYETFNCLTVSSLGVLTVTPTAGATCLDPDSPSLWVVLTDAGGNPLGMNTYVFKITDPRRPRR